MHVSLPSVSSFSQQEINMDDVQHSRHNTTKTIMMIHQRIGSESKRHKI